MCSNKREMFNECDLHFAGHGTVPLKDSCPLWVLGDQFNEKCFDKKCRRKALG